MAQEISVGSLATAKHDSGVCESGEIGVCYEVYQIGNRPGYSFIFERGGYDGFSPDDVKMFLDVSGRVSRDAAGHEFRNVGQLDTDYRAGRFDAAFKEQNHAREDAAMEAAWERSAMAHPRDLLKREMLEEAKGCPRDVALEKHGANIEMDIMRDLERMREVERQPGRLDWPEAQVLSSHDRRALTAYEEHCRSHGIPATETGRNQWLNEWRTLNEEQRQDAVDAERNRELDWPQDETSMRGAQEPDTDLER